MKQYAVTVVIYMHAQDEEQATMAADMMIDREYLYGSRGESVSVVEVSEVKFTEDI
jgi:hypothetical protein